MQDKHTRINGTWGRCYSHYASLRFAAQAERVPRVSKNLEPGWLVKPRLRFSRRIETENLCGKKIVPSVNDANSLNPLVPPRTRLDDFYRCRDNDLSRETSSTELENDRSSLLLQDGRSSVS